MKCPNCGHEVREGQAFCTNCGSPLPRAGASDEGASQQGHATPRPNICPKCGRSLPEGSVFCPNCGTRVAVGTGPVADPSDSSRTQPMPVLPQNPPRVEAVPAPPQEAYSPQGKGSGRPTNGRGGSKTPLIVVGAIAAVVVVALVVIAVLGAGPFQGSGDSTSDQPAAEVTNGSISANGNSNASNAANANGTANANESSSNASAASNGNANQNTSAANANASANANSNAGANANSNTGNTANSSNANAGDDDGTSGSVSLNGGYVSNSNSAYGYSLTVPTSFTLSGSDSAGNATLTDTASPCVITVSVDNNPNGYTVDQALANASASASSNAYTAEGNGWYVVSDEPNGSVYYVMSYVQQGRTISLRFSYPTSAKSQCDPIIESVQPTFSVN